MFHLCGHSVIKMTLFLTAGNILLAYGTRSVSAVGGMFGTIPKNAVIWITGLLLICGTPPSPLFVTELLLGRAALAGRLGARSAVRRFRRNVDGVPENGNGKKRNTGKNIVSGKAGGKIVGHAVLRRCHSTGVRHNASVDTEYGETLI